MRALRRSVGKRLRRGVCRGRWSALLPCMLRRKIRLLYVVHVQQSTDRALKCDSRLAGMYLFRCWAQRGCHQIIESRARSTSRTTPKAPSMKTLTHLHPQQAPLPSERRTQTPLPYERRTAHSRVGGAAVDDGGAGRAVVARGGSDGPAANAHVLERHAPERS